MSAAAPPAHESRDLLLPAGTRLVHIGPPKTGTTALQAAFHLARDSAREQDVHYAGYGRHSASEVRAVVGLRSPWDKDRKPPNIRYWNRLAREIRSSDARCVVLSSEAFARADTPTIERVVHDIAPEGAPVHIVLTLRPLARLLPSQWQQYVQNRLTTPFDAWLEPNLASRDSERLKDYWGRHRDDELVQRWAAVVGVENVTAIVLDEGDPGFLFRNFEAMVGLRPGTLVPDAALSNRSLTLPEIEAIRAFNVLFRAENLPKPLYTRAIRRGAAPLMERRRPGPDEPRVELPAWAIEPVTRLAGDLVEAIRASGVQVIGDLDRLLVARTNRTDAPQEVAIPPDVAANLGMGILVASGAARGSSAADTDDEPLSGGPAELARPYAESPELMRISTPHLLLTVARRAKAGLVHRLASLLRRGGGGARRGGRRRRAAPPGGPTDRPD